MACLLAEQDCWTRQASVVFRDSKQQRFSIFTRKSAKLTVNCRPVSTTRAQTQHARIPHLKNTRGAAGTPCGTVDVVTGSRFMVVPGAAYGTVDVVTGIRFMVTTGAPATTGTVMGLVAVAIGTAVVAKGTGCGYTNGRVPYTSEHARRHWYAKPQRADDCAGGSERTVGIRNGGRLKAWWQAYWRSRRYLVIGWWRWLSAARDPRSKEPLAARAGALASVIVVR